MRTDRQAGMTKQIVAFRRFAKAPINLTWEVFQGILCKAAYEDGRLVAVVQDRTQ
jgi:hypothetical protein